MSWRPASERPNPLHALRRIAERPDAAAAGRGLGEVVRVNVGVAVLDRVRPQRVRRARPPIVSRRPASEPEPSHRSPDRRATALITTTPLSEAPDLGPLAPLPVPARPTEYVAGPVLRAALGLAPAPSTPVLIPPSAAPAPSVSAVAVPVPAAVPPLVAPPDDPPAVVPRLADLAPLVATPPAPAVPAVADLGELRDPDARRQLNLRQVLVGLVACLGLFTLVDAPALARSAEHSQLGTRRTVALDVLHPISRVSAALGLDRLDRWIQELRGHPLPTRHSTPPIVVHPLPLVVTRPRPTPIVLAPLRIPTPADPLRVLVIGDSLGLSFGQSLATKLDATKVVTTTVDAREGTGLARPDAFDWPGQLRADIVHFHPEIIVASFGGNDDQDVLVNGRYVTFNSPAWQAIYRGRVAEVAATAKAAHTRLAWAGLPVVRSGAKTARLAAVMAQTKAALTGVDAAIFVDNFPTLADAAGHYQVALPDASGNTVIVRQPDGIHETPAGADRLADKLIAAMRTRWHAAV